MKANEPVAKIMSTKLRTVRPDQKLSEVRSMLAEGLFHHVPVVRNEKLIGLISSTDMLRAGSGASADVQDGPLADADGLSEVMQKFPITVSPNTSVREAAEMLANGHFHSLPVVEENDKLVGMLTTTDLVNYLLDQY